MKHEERLPYVARHKDEGCLVNAVVTLCVQHSYEIGDFDRGLLSCFDFYEPRLTFLLAVDVVRPGMVASVMVDVRLTTVYQPFCGPILGEQSFRCCFFLLSCRHFDHIAFEVSCNLSLICVFPDQIYESVLSAGSASNDHAASSL
jgi:hypothetical protein